MNERTVRRAREVRRRARQYRRRREGRLNGALSACSLLLLTGIGTLCRDAQTPGGLALAAQGFGSVLLRRGAGRYAVIGIAAFAAGAALTIVCVRRRKRRTDRTSAAEESEEIL